MEENTLSYTAWEYYAIVLIVLIAYYVIPKKYRWFALLVGSIYFYTQLIYRLRQIAIFLVSIFVSYITAIIIEEISNRAQKGKTKEKTKRTREIEKSKLLKYIVLWIGIVFTALPLLLEKFGGFLFGSVIHRPTLPLIIPVGLSFYTLQLVAYVVDVYHGKIKAQRNPLKFGLFASFFPQIIQGPIPRYEKLENQLFDGNKYDFNNIVSGLQLVLWGFFLKYMIADKSAVIVNTVFDNYNAYSGGYIWLAAILYSIQLYTDFLSCTTMSQGVAEMFGIHLDNNFERPYFSTSIKEFWRRWHMSLSLWLKDYIYIPLGGNRKGTFRKWMNLLITFAVSGIWHGGSWKFLFWGLLHAVYQITGEIRIKIKDKFNIHDIGLNDCVRRILSQVLTFFFVMIAWIIFRADSFRGAVAMIKSMFTSFNPWIWVDDSVFKLGLNWKECAVLVISMLILFIVSKMQEEGKHIRSIISDQNIVIRWSIYLIVIWLIWICGSYGFGFDAKDFIYGGF